MHADTHTHKPMNHKTSSFIKSSCEWSRIKGSMWSRAAELQRRSGPDGFQSVRQTCSPLLCFIRLCYVIYCSSLFYSLCGYFPSCSVPLLYFMLFLFWWSKIGTTAGGFDSCKPAMCVRYVRWRRATRLSVYASDHKHNKPTRTRYC